MRRSRQRGSGESGLSRLHPRSSVVAWRAREGSGYDERGHAAAVMQLGGGAAVLAQQSAQPGCHQDLSFTIAEREIAGRGRSGRLRWGRARLWCSTYSFRMHLRWPSFKTKSQSSASRRAEATQRSAIECARHLRGGVRRTSVPSAASTKSKARRGDSQLRLGMQSPSSDRRPPGWGW